METHDLTPSIQLIPGQHVHLIGIGGSGMSAIARLLLLQGYHVTGSDKHRNAVTAALEQEGARIYEGHSAAQVQGAELVIATSAAPLEHVEIQAALERGIPVYRRSDVMSAIMSGHVGIAVAGTHGKTTTTSMIVHVLKSTGQDPSYIVGGVMANTGTNADVGMGRTFVIEADEYGHMFLGLRPTIAVITSIEYDHPDFFASPNELVEAFLHFVALLPDDGLLIACADDPTAQIFARNRQVVQLPVITYGIDNPADWQATNIRYHSGMTYYDVLHDGQSLGSVQLGVPGKHNILNSLAALVVAHYEGVAVINAVRALASFKGTGRRFEVRADEGEIAVIDDYAHHPTAVRVTIDAARNRYPERDLWAVWQPHTFSRTRHLWDEFLASFVQAQHVIVTDIYAAREADDPAVRSANFVAELAHPSKYHAPTLEDAVELLLTHVQAPAVILIMSAGDAPQIGVDYVQRKRASTS